MEYQPFRSIVLILEVPDWLKTVALVLLFIGAGIAIISVVLLYIGARLFIVIESFISLRHVPVGVYLTPDKIS